MWPISKANPSVPAAYEIGMTKAKLMLPRYDIQYRIEDTNCNARIGMEAIIKLKEELHGLDGIIGSRCSVVCEPVALLTAAWNIPQVANRCSSMFLSNKRRYPTFTRSAMSILWISQVFLGVLRMFGWKQLSIITLDSLIYKSAAEDLKKLCVEQSMTAKLYTFKTTIIGNVLDQENVDILRLLVKEMKQISRVIGMYMGDDDMRNLLAIAKHEGMLQGDYVFLGIGTLTRKRFPDEYLDKHLNDVEVYQGIMALIENDPPETDTWKHFQKDLRTFLSVKNKSQSNIQIHQGQLFAGKTVSQQYIDFSYRNVWILLF